MSGTNPGYIGVPEIGTDDVEHRRKLAKTLNSVLQGKINALCTITLTANSTTTILQDARITNNSFIGFMPLTANASSALGSLYVSNRMAGNATTLGNAIITHANNAQTDRTFNVLIIG